MTILNEVLQALAWFKFTEMEKRIVHGYAAHIRSGVQIENFISTPEQISLIWFKKIEYRLGLPPSFHDKNSELSDVVCWCGYDVFYDIEITKSNAITGYVFVTFPQAYDEMMSVSVLVSYNVMINGVDYGPFHQFTSDTADIMWREEPPSEDKRNHENSVTFQVCVIEFHSIFLF